MKFSPRVLFAAILVSCADAAAQESNVHIRFFHTECRECDEITSYLDELTASMGSQLVIHDCNYADPTNYLLMARIELALGVTENEAVSVYVGTNHLYGVNRIKAGLESLIAAGLKAGGVPLWLPEPAGETNAAASASGASDAVVERFHAFSPVVIVAAGLLDGINPCAFATLILFVSLLGCYRSGMRDIVLTSAVFSLAVFLTYLALGIGLLTALKSLAGFSTAAMVLHWGLVAFCAVLAVLSAADAVRARRAAGRQHDFMLGLPPSWRVKISSLLSTYVGRRKWLAGVFGVGIVVSLLESVCTGQVYVPTLAYVMRITDLRLVALGWLVLYNVCFIAPIIVLAILVATGVRSQRLLEWQHAHGVSSRVVMACLFAILATVLAFT